MKLLTTSRSKVKVPFNLQEALNGAMIVTRDDRMVQKVWLAEGSCDDIYPVGARLPKDPDDYEIFSYTLQGARWRNKEHHTDLFIIKE